MIGNIKQHLCVWMACGRANSCGSPCLHNAALPHDVNESGNALHHGAIVSNRQHRHVQLASQGLNKLKNLKLHSGVQGRVQKIFRPEG